MRVATQAYTDAMLNQFNLLAGKQYSLQSQVATGLRVQSASDDPVAMKNTLDYAAEKAALTQYGTNIGTLQSRADAVYGALQSLQTISSRVGEITTSAATATSSPSDLNGYAQEVNNLIQQVVSAANTKDSSSGKFLFGGTASGQPPYTVTTDASGNVTAVTYQGNNTVNQTEIGVGQSTSADVPGDNAGSSSTRGLITDQQTGGDFLNHLISLRDNLLAGNKTAITATDSANLKRDENNLAYQIANNGVTQNQLTAAAAFASNRAQTLDGMISNESGADLTQTMVQLSQAQTSYQAALQSGVKIMQLSILNYL
jgi:flagellar hook-associated protein 3 FlgL